MALLIRLKSELASSLGRFLLHFLFKQQWTVLPGLVIGGKVLVSFLNTGFRIIPPRVLAPIFIIVQFYLEFLHFQFYWIVERARPSAAEITDVIS